MNKLCFFLFFMVLQSFSFSLIAAESNKDEEIAFLKEQVKLLMQRVTDLEKNQKNTAETKKEVALLHKVEKKDGLQWEIRGYAKLDTVYSSTSAGANSIGDEFIVNSLIPRKDQDGEDGQLKLTARESRIMISTDYAFSGGHFKTFISGDFFGNKPSSSETLNNNADFRLRQAFGDLQTEYGNFRIGQAWSTFQNLSAFPHMTTLGVLPGQIFTRVAQIRYSWPFEQGSIQFSMENPESHFRDSQNTAIRPDDDRAPDFVTRVNWTPEWGHLSLAGLLRDLRCDIPGVCEDDATGWGISAAGRIVLGGKDNLRFQANWGDGMGRFTAGTVYPGAIIDDNGQLQTVEVKSMMLSYQHWWSERWSSALIFNIADANNLSINPNAIEQLQTYNVNLLWWPINRLRLGLELLHADSELVDNSEGELTRLTFSSKFIF